MNEIDNKNKNMGETFTRKCPRCGDEIKHKYRRHKIEAERNNRTCFKCSIEKLKKYVKEHRKYKTKEKRIENEKILALRRKEERDIKRKGGDIKSAMWYVRNSARHTALDKKKEYNLSIKYLMELYNKQGGRCYYTGKKLITNRPSKRGNIEMHKISIDRINSKLGYIEGNIALCTAWANFAKHNYNEEELYKECKAMVRHYRKKIRNNGLNNNISNNNKEKKMEQMELF